MRWPALLGMMMLAIPGAMLAAGLRPAVLAGVLRPAPWPGLTAGALWSGAFQREAAAWFGRADPALSAAVALRNQAYFSVLGQSAVPEVVVGPGLQLVETAYIAEFCSRDASGLAPRAEVAAARLAAMQAWYAARGRQFLYLITPNKAGAEPELIPRGWPCRSRPGGGTAILALWREALRRHAVQWVDGPAIIAAARGTAPLFPRGGTHWSWVGAALATQALVAAVDRARPGTLAAFTFTWHDAPPEGTDRDLTDLLNLPFPRLDYPAPVVDLMASAPAPCKPPLIAEIGGSFTFHIDFLLARLPCPPRIAFYNYYYAERASFDPFTRGPVDPAQRSADLLGGADIVVLEENEDRVFRSNHAGQLWDLLRSEGGLP